MLGLVVVKVKAIIRGVFFVGVSEDRVRLLLVVIRERLRIISCHSRTDLDHGSDPPALIPLVGPTYLCNIMNCTNKSLRK